MKPLWITWFWSQLVFIYAWKTPSNGGGVSHQFGFIKIKETTEKIRNFSHRTFQTSYLSDKIYRDIHPNKFILLCTKHIDSIIWNLNDEWSLFPHDNFVWFFHSNYRKTKLCKSVWCTVDQNNDDAQWLFLLFKISSSIQTDLFLNLVIRWRYSYM